MTAPARMTPEREAELRRRHYRFVNALGEARCGGHGPTIWGYPCEVVEVLDALAAERALRVSVQTMPAFTIQELADYLTQNPQTDLTVQFVRLDEHLHAAAVLNARANAALADLTAERERSDCWEFRARYLLTENSEVLGYVQVSRSSLLVDGVPTGSYGTEVYAAELPEDIGLYGDEYAKCALVPVKE